LIASTSKQGRLQHHVKGEKRLKEKKAKKRENFHKKGGILQRGGLGNKTFQRRIFIRHQLDKIFLEQKRSLSEGEDLFCTFKDASAFRSRGKKKNV